ncbi:hypothetical protein OSB04_008240 [Centaurea solstitialis]|uniref:DUF3700 domain-containing protein n=1 Tax=Centaurea solstitialis TaxID=347529 RepID=A0AA38TY32_9ASTR|nr:hypothetical protein OSB04_008240 [Centaurea solstitialis]
MLGVFKNGLVSPPKELNSPSATNQPPAAAANNQNPLQSFLSYHNNNVSSMSFGNDASLAYAHSSDSFLPTQRLFSSVDDIHCLFLGSLNNLCALNKQYGLNKGANESMFVIQAYKTLRDRGPYPAHSVLKDLEGSFGFVGNDGRVMLFWGISADGSVVISDNLEVIKNSCSKSFAPFPTGCLYHTGGELKSFEHPKNKMKAISRVDSEGAMCGATFKVDIYAKTKSMPGLEVKLIGLGANKLDSILTFF